MAIHEDDDYPIPEMVSDMSRNYLFAQLADLQKRYRELMSYPALQNETNAANVAYVAYFDEVDSVNLTADYAKQISKILYTRIAALKEAKESLTVPKSILKEEPIMSAQAQTTASTETNSTTPKEETMNANTTSAAQEQTAAAEKTPEQIAAEKKAADLQRLFGIGAKYTTVAAAATAATVAANACRPWIISKVLEVTGWGLGGADVIAQSVVETVAETTTEAAASTVADTAAAGSAGFFETVVTTVTEKVATLPQGVVIAAAVAAAVVVTYGAYRLYKRLFGTKAAETIVKQTAAPEKAATEQTSKESVTKEEPNSILTSILAGLVAGGKMGLKIAAMVLVYSIAGTLAAIAIACGLPLLGLAIKAMLWAFVAYQLAKAVFIVATAWATTVLAKAMMSSVTDTVAAEATAPAAA